MDFESSCHLPLNHLATQKDGGMSLNDLPKDTITGFSKLSSAQHVLNLWILPFFPLINIVFNIVNCCSNVDKKS